MSEFFKEGTCDQFEFALSIYQQTLLAKAETKSSKSMELVQLDNWFQNDLPTKIQSRGSEAHITHEELVQTITWKLLRGKFRPRLKEFVTSNPASMVLEVSKKSIKMLLSTFDVEGSIESLCALKGVGPALASAVLSAAAPQLVPFMADECLLSTPGIDRCQYTIKEYSKYVDSIRECVNRLNSRSQGTVWTPHKVELAIWAHCIAANLKPELLVDIPSTLTNKQGCVDTKANAEDDVVQEMDQVEVTRIDGSLVPVKLPAGEHFLGRGPLLQIADTKVSRKHAKINISDDGEVEFTALHANPCFVRENGGQWTSLSQHRSWLINKNLEIKFTENLWHFKFSIIGDKLNDENRDSLNESTTVESVENAVTKPKMLNQWSKPIPIEPESEPSKPTASETDQNTSTDVESKGVDREQKVLQERVDTSIEPEPSKITSETSKPPSEPSKITSEPSKPTSEPIPTKSPKKRQLPSWLLKLTADNGASSLRSSPKKRKHDSEDEETLTELKPSPNKCKTPTKSPKRAKKDPLKEANVSPSTSSDTKTSVDTLKDLSSRPSTSKDSNIGTSNLSLVDNESNGALTSNDKDSDDEFIQNISQESDESNSGLTSNDYTKVKTENDKDRKTEFPVLITAEDLEDSDDEGEKENKNKQKVVKKKVDQASRPCCPHGATCYRKNPAHFTDEAHPGDPDFKDPDDVESDDERPECEFGTDCYRKNPDHRRNFRHSRKPQPKRTAKVKNKKKGQGDDDDLDDSFIDDDSEESIDDTDEDEDYAPELNSSQD